MSRYLFLWKGQSSSGRSHAGERGGALRLRITLPMPGSKRPQPGHKSEDHDDTGRLDR